MNEIKRLQELAGIKEKYVITNGKEWFAGAKDYMAFAKHKSEANLYQNYEEAKEALTLIPDNIIKEKQLKIETQ